jgi:maltose-binding protein MalE
MKKMLTLLLPIVFLPMCIGCGAVDRSDKVVIWEQMDPREQDLLDRHIESFILAHPQYSDIKITRAHYNVEDLRTQFQTAALAYGGPNLVYGPSDQIGPFSIMELVEPLENILPDSVLSRFDKTELPILNNHIYGIPDQIGNHLTLVANLDLIDELPTNSDQWVEQLKALTIDKDNNGRPEQFGLVFNMAEPFWLVPFLGGYGGWVMDVFGKPTLHSEAMTGALKFMLGLKTSGVVPRECDYPLADTLFKEGRAAYIINGPWSWDGYRSAGLNIKLLPIPMISETGLWPTPMTSAKCYSVNKYLHPDTRECTIALLIWLTSAKIQEDLCLELGVLPSDLETRKRSDLLENELLADSRTQIDKGKLMPIVPEMRAIWDSMRPAYQSCLNGELSPADASKQMQQRAIKMISRMHE